MTILSDGNTKPVREDSAPPTPVGGKASPRAAMMPQIVNLEEESDFGPFLGEVEPPAQVTKFVPRKPLEPIRVSVIADAQAKSAAAPVSVRAPLLPLLPLVRGLASWRNISLGLLALLVVGQAGYMALWMRSSESPLPTTGSVTVTSSPSGSPVTIDGAASGQTPLTLSLAAGSHRIEIGSGAQLNSQELSVAGGGNASLHVELAQVSAPPASAATVESPKAAEESAAARATSVNAPRAAAPVAVPTGWLAVTSGIPMQILDKGILVGSSEMPRIVLPAGAHELELVNAGLDYRVFRNVEITAGETTSVGLKPPMGTLAVNALPWAEVWIDGQRAGETPIGNLSIEIGNHEVLFRHPELGEQRRIVTVGALGPARIGVDMKKP